jgi:hypothetical protein
MTSSYLVRACTSRSAGLSRLRMSRRGRSRQVRHEAAPERIGQLHTIGSVVDCLRSCESTGELLAMITSGAAATTAAASPRKRSGSSVAQR